MDSTFNRGARALTGMGHVLISHQWAGATELHARTCAGQAAWVQASRRANTTAVARETHFAVVIGATALIAGFAAVQPEIVVLAVV